MKGKVGFISLGCAKNLINSEQMMYLLKKAGFEVTGGTEGVDAVIVNTCAFIESAKSEAIDAIIELGAMKDEGRVGKLIVAGCLPERYRNEIMPELPEIDAVLGTGRFDDIVGVLKSVLASGDKPALFGDIDKPVSETKRVLTTSPAWAYIKIAEGCDNRCAYCVIPDIRGNFRSREIGNIVNEARELAARGTKELIIIAQDVTRYGLDLYGKRRLTDLLSELCDIEPLKWIRLHYLYPNEIDEELIDVIAKNDKILKYLDIPIQHINDEILKNMHRKGSGGDIRSLIKILRTRIPEVVIRTSLIAGLPGEGENEFEELCVFLREAKIERAGIFAYSPEDGTQAALMDRPDSDVAARRAEMLTDIQSLIMDEFNKSRVGNVETVLIEGYDRGQFIARSYAESPDVDGYIYVSGGNITVNEFVDVRITEVIDGELLAVSVTDS